MIDSTNQTPNYKRHHVRDMCKAIHELSPERKQDLLSKIKLQKGCHDLMGQDYNHQNCEYIEALLNGKRPKNNAERG